ncbi:related to JLP1-Fe(II)-dependent sulfonate/alpha-ketoglutarate dioxygenase [Ustilago bromivora]|uniref:Related to JLP1 - Fe(II)-dependent sulfonate/alpha-ketoglutarate dioxygenase n=1 Tax=Ustilago bromivora TaxID=307758 RepID=A0A1K0GA51_9BASI|nr:related to JLP1-Fe(II)-dependent sulfonate/alpha-ketoglutarate dioxygenase [Ustilago bromivora]SYW86201.1 related to JLP1 - Fe(II)-dependent sulfonate/alpha-ketoglutarate dioxygenase [Ustilago bromivora]
MAPVAVERRPASPEASSSKAANPVVKKQSPRRGLTNRAHQYSSEHFDLGALASEEDYPYNDFKPSFPKARWDAYEPITPPKDRALFADPEKKALFGAATAVKDLTRTIGTELEGIRLGELTDAQKDELALLVAERGVAFFRGQDDWTIEQQLELGRYWGPLHKHATTGVPARGDLEEVHVVYSHPTSDPGQKVYRGPVQHSRADLWHSDVTYEINPPSYTSFKLLVSPEAGGDTLWASGYAAYDRLSYPLRQYLESLTAIHSAVDQAEGARRFGNTVRREPVETEHPLVRVHPVTKHKALFFNPGFCKYIPGVPKAESDYLIAFLTNHVSTASDFSVRFKWNAGDVAIWDNRTNIHSAIYEDVGVSRRHAIRVAVRGEIPQDSEDGTSREEEYYKARGFKVDKTVAKGQRRQAGYKD